jgi:hypothetical protein
MNRRKLTLGLLSATSLVIGTAQAVTRTWDKGANSLNWNDPVNWSNDTKPGASDTASFTSAGVASGDTVLLGANQTNGTLTVGSSAPTFTISGGGSYSLTLVTGKITGGYVTPSRHTTFDAPVILGTNGAFEAYGTYGSQLFFNGPISDGGNGYSVFFSPGNNYDYTLRGDNTYTGDTVVQGKTVTLAGTDGAIRPSRLVFRPASDSANRIGLNLDNAAVVNTNRLSDTLPVLNEYGAGFINMIGNTNSPVSEEAGLLQISNGVVQLRATYNGTNLALRFSEIQRAAGSGLVFDYSGGTIVTNTKLTIAGAVTNASGVWQPWAIFGGDTQYDPVHSTVDENGTLNRFSNYLTLPDSGSDGAKLYQATAASQTLTASQEVYALMMRKNGDATLDLGAYDLRLSGGSVGFTTHGSKTIQSSGGGRLVFGTPDVVIFGSTDVGTKLLTISAPIASDVAGPYNLVIPLVRVTSRLALTGEDQIGTYAKLAADMSTLTLELGGPSDRAFTNVVSGRFNLLKSGAGTLRMAGVDLRNDGTTTVTGGRLAVGKATAVRTSYSDNFCIVTNSVLEVEAGVNWSGRFTLQANATLTGDGRINTVKTITNTVHVAPGKGVGQLTTIGLTVGAGAHLDWQLGAGSATAGADYDLLRVEGNLALPAGAVTVHLYDAATGVADVSGKSFTLVEWTGTTPPANSPSWPIVNHSPTLLDASQAQVTVDTANKRILLTGLKRAPKGTQISIQ